MNENNINEQKILTANQMTAEVLLSLVLYGVIFYIIFRIIYALTYKSFTENHNYILLAFFIIVLQFFIVFAIYKLVNRSILKKGNIYKNDVGKVMKNIAFVVLTLLVIQVIAAFANVEESIDKVIEEDYMLKYKEQFLSYMYNETEMAIYQTEKENAIEEAKKILYGYIAIIEIGMCVIYLGALFFEKKYLYSKAI